MTSDVKEAEFLCVMVVHVSSQHKNAADDKLKLCMRKFCDTHKGTVTLVLISGDVDFAADLSHMRYAHNYKIILIHNKPHHSSIKTALRVASHEIYSLDKIVLNAPEKELQLLEEFDVNGEQVNWVKLTNFPANVPLSHIKPRLYSLAYKTKGSVIHCSKKMAILQYSMPTLAERASKRMHNQDVHGSKVTATRIIDADQAAESCTPVKSGFTTPTTTSVVTGSMSPTSKLGLVHPYSHVAGLPTPPDSATIPSIFNIQSFGTSLPCMPDLPPLPVAEPNLFSPQSEYFCKAPGSRLRPPSSFSNPCNDMQHSYSTGLYGPLLTPPTSCAAPVSPPDINCLFFDQSIAMLGSRCFTIKVIIITTTTVIMSWR
ncbi:KIAA0430 [Bugula neritina]|uniref:KIAA0430 n=1 Tax=Bugula neritina TaxID=10212 RepID=A0A7J7IVX2_BUGNE|nr:KIAA0430 [Bugula neritina]